MTKPLFVALLVAGALLSVLFLLDSLLRHSGCSFFMVLVVAAAASELVRRYALSQSPDTTVTDAASLARRAFLSAQRNR